MTGLPPGSTGGVPSDRPRRRGERGGAGDAVFREMFRGHALSREFAGVLAAEIAKALRAQPGVNVREPSHHAAPYRGLEWCFQIRTTVGINSELIVPVTLSQRVGNFNPPAEPDVFPAGLLGVMHVANVWAYRLAAPALASDGFNSAFWSLLVDGNPLPGCFRRISGGIGGMHQQTAAAVPIQFTYNAAAVSMPTIVPVTIRPGSRLSFVLRNEDAAVDWTFVAWVAGWLYPVTGAGEGIEETLTD